MADPMAFCMVIIGIGGAILTPFIAVTWCWALQHMHNAMEAEDRIHATILKQLLKEALKDQKR